MNTNLNLKEWAEEDRPREKLIQKGTNSLSNAELLAILIGSGTRTKTAVELAKEILTHYSNELTKISQLTISELCQFKGIGEAKAVSIKAGLELSKRKLMEESTEITKISSSNMAYKFLRPHFLDEVNEAFGLIYLNRANKIIGYDRISNGGRSATVVDGKVIFKNAISNNASAIILSHNHPSGEVSPSKADVSLTNRMIEFGKMIDCKVLDHIIIGDKKYFSFADQGMMG